MRQLPKDWNELERMTGIKRTVAPSPTQRDARYLTARKLRGPFWRRKRP